APNALESLPTLITPTPMPVLLDTTMRVHLRELYEGNDLVIVVEPPEKHVVLMEGRREEDLGAFHLCSGEMRRCSGGIASRYAIYFDEDKDGIADKLKIYFDRAEVFSLLNSRSAAETVDDVIESVPETEDDATPSDDVSRRRPRTVTLTVSGNVYAWQLTER
ncbi:MAG: hypothetical protein KC547_20410, partial [Anaerolineae bacterium]|nr:hypothetical protein [Anaerolineae bacterium]